MSSFRDELRTVLSIEGLSAYLSGLQQAQAGNPAATAGWLVTACGSKVD